jgi:hypothetical protein
MSGIEMKNANLLDPFRMEPHSDVEGGITDSRCTLAALAIPSSLELNARDAEELAELHEQEFERFWNSELEDTIAR